MKYTKFCGGIHGDCAASLKNHYMCLWTKYIKSFICRKAVRLSYVKEA